MIDERMEELAGLYVLGLLAPAGQSTFEATLRGDSELQTLVAGLLTTRDAMAGAVPAATPSPQVKQRIMAELDARVKKTVSRPVRPASPNWLAFWLPWALSTAAIAVCVHFYATQSVLKNQLARQTARVAELDQLADSLRQATNQLTQTVAAQSVLKDQLARQTARVAELDQLADALRDATNQLAQTVAGLQTSTKLADVRIALLNSMLGDAPKAMAVSLWDQQQQNGVFVVQNLKPLPSDRDYQLWVIDPQYKVPVSAGVFQVDSSGNMRVHFKANKAIVTANKFAVTLEPKGGLPTPTLKNLVLLGG